MKTWATWIVKVMKLNYNLTEGLRTGDLKDLVLPTVSVDEYQSKIEDDGLVVAVKVDDEEPGKDLVRFIEKSDISILDAEVSPGPDPDGYFYVFVEFVRGKDFPKEFQRMLKQISNLTGIENWKMKAYHVEKSVPVTEDTIRKNVRLESTEQNVEESLVKELKICEANKIHLKGNRLRLDDFSFRIVAFGSESTLYEAFGFNYKPVQLTETALSEAIKVSKKFGPVWQVDKIDNYFVCKQIGSENVLILSSE